MGTQFARFPVTPEMVVVGYGQTAKDFAVFVKDCEVSALEMISIFEFGMLFANGKIMRVVKESTCLPLQLVLL